MLTAGTAGVAVTGAGLFKVGKDGVSQINEWTTDDAPDPSGNAGNTGTQGKQGEPGPDGPGILDTIGNAAKKAANWVYTLFHGKERETADLSPEGAAIFGGGLGLITLLGGWATGFPMGAVGWAAGGLAIAGAVGGAIFGEDALKSVNTPPANAATNTPAGDKKADDGKTETKAEEKTEKTAEKDKSATSIMGDVDPAKPVSPSSLPLGPKPTGRDLFATANFS